MKCDDRTANCQLSTKLIMDIRIIKCFSSWIIDVENRKISIICFEMFECVKIYQWICHRENQKYDSVNISNKIKIKCFARLCGLWMLFYFSVPFLIIKFSISKIGVNIHMRNNILAFDFWFDSDDKYFNQNSLQTQFNPLHLQQMTKISFLIEMKTN